jgi:acetyl-CoA synthetase
MTEIETHKVPASFRAKAHIDRDTYLAMYKRSIENPDAFWSEQADAFVTWSRRWDTVCEADFINGRFVWFKGAQLNVSYNCIDRHLNTRADQTAIIWESDDPSVDSRITYRELHQHVCRLANALKSRGVKKGDRVCIYMPMIPEAAYAMLACARIGAVHSVVFGGFSPQSLKDRILDSDCRVVITADEGVRGGRPVPLKQNTEEALASCPNVHTVLTVKRTGGKVPWTNGRDVWYHDLVAAQSDACEPQAMDAEDPLFILYTSGSTGKPKGVQHSTGG